MSYMLLAAGNGGSLAQAEGSGQQAGVQGAVGQGAAGRMAAGRGAAGRMAAGRGAAGRMAAGKGQSGSGQGGSGQHGRRQRERCCPLLGSNPGAAPSGVAALHDLSCVSGRRGVSSHKGKRRERRRAGSAPPGCPAGSALAQLLSSNCAIHKIITEGEVIPETGKAGLTLLVL